jgi:hypothetical protein
MKIIQRMEFMWSANLKLPSAFFLSEQNSSVWTSYLQLCKSVISSQTVAEEQIPQVPSFGLPW